MTTRHSPAQWAIITDAIATADTATVDLFGDPLVRGQEDWCRVAFTAMEAPAAIARTATAPDPLPERCLLDTRLLRAWLGAPAAYADSFVVTVADLVADRDWSQTADETTQEGLQRLLDAAQDAGVFGVDGLRVELHGVTGEDGWISRHLVVARPAFGPGLASEPLDGITPTVSMSAVDSAIAVLSTIAREVDTILDGFAAQPWASTGRDRMSGHAFPPPASADPATPTPPAATPAAPDGGNKRGR